MVVGEPELQTVVGRPCVGEEPETEAAALEPRQAQPSADLRRSMMGSLISWLRLLSRHWLWACALLLTAAVALGARGSWLPLGDNALMRMWTEAVGGPNTPLVGGDSRYGWNHLGPWLFYLLAIPYRLLGRSARGLLIGAGAINIWCLVMICRCVRSVANERVAALFGAGALLFVLTAQGPRLIDPWNPYVAQLPFLLAVVACWAMMNGEGRWLAWLIGAGSVAAQSHITFLPPVIVLIVVALACVVAKRATLTRSQWRWTAGVTIVAWAPALIDLFRPGGNNVWKVVKFFFSSSPGSSAAGGGAGFRVLLRETGLSGSWLGGRPGLEIFSDGFDGRLGFAPGLGLLVLAGSAWLAWHQRDRVAATFAILVAALAFTGIAEMAGARGPLYPYLFGWVSIVGMLCWLAPMMALASRVPGRFGRHAAQAMVLTVSVIIGVVSVHATQPRSPRERGEDVGIVRQLVEGTTAQLNRHQHYHLVHGHDAFNSIYELGVVDELRQQHFAVVVDPSGVVLFGRHMVDPAADTYPELEVIAPYDQALPGDRVLALADPLTSAQRQEEHDLAEKLIAAYTQAGHPDAANLIAHDDGKYILLAAFNDPDPALQPMLERLSFLRQQGRSVAVILREQPSQQP